MQKIVLSIGFFFLMLSAFSQSDKYMDAMMSKVSLIDSIRNVDSLKDLSAAFERIGDAEKTQWLPYYYAALTQINSGYMISMGNGMKGGVADKIDPIADKAEQLIGKAEELNKDNSEIYIIKKMIATLRLTADPMNRYMQYGPEAQQALDKAKQLNPENPRVYLLEGEDKLFTPEEYGGSKEEAKKLFEQAIQKFDSFKAASSIDPNWGRHTTEYFLSQIKA